MVIFQSAESEDSKCFPESSYTRFHGVGIDIPVYKLIPDIPDFA